MADALTYQSAGVDLEKYQHSMSALPALLQRTHDTQRGRVMDLPGGFAGLFRLNGGGKNYRDPVLVSGTDGVGTKLKIATEADRFDTVGIDLVAMCVNDCLCLGAEPLFFLDYLAMPHDNPDRVEALVRGVALGCVEAQCALLGGETAVMPGVYPPEEYDMAGFCVGIVERENVLDGSRILAGDVILGLRSSGLHSNGFSLVRKIVFEHAGLGIEDHIPELGRTIAEELLEPTRIYSRALAALRDSEQLANVHGIAHITGGGLRENIERVLPEGVALELSPADHLPAVFDWLQQLGNVAADEMARVFNMGYGMAMIVPQDKVAEISATLASAGYENDSIGGIRSA